MEHLSKSGIEIHAEVEVDRELQRMLVSIMRLKDAYRPDLSLYDALLQTAKDAKPYNRTRFAGALDSFRAVLPLGDKVTIGDCTRKLLIVMRFSKDKRHFLDFACQVSAGLARAGPDTEVYFALSYCVKRSSGLATRPVAYVRPGEKPQASRLEQVVSDFAETGGEEGVDESPQFEMFLNDVTRTACLSVDEWDSVFGGRVLSCSETVADGLQMTPAGSAQ